MKVELPYKYGQTVYLKTDVEQYCRMVTGYKLGYNTVLIELTCGTNISYHYEYEISEEKEVLI